MRVYLDSSDYSFLSDPRRKSDVTAAICQKLHAWAESGAVQFVFSGAHLSEMAPLDAAYTPAAVARAELLAELCGRNAFISHDRLLTIELASIDKRESCSERVLSLNSDWFPDLGTLVTPIQWADRAKKVDDVVKERGLNRDQRRKLKRVMFKHGRPKDQTKRLFAESKDHIDFDAFLRLYPMRPQDAKVISGYVAGTASLEEANEAFLESLRDPRWMMRWFADHHKDLTSVTEWLRGPSVKFVTTLKSLADEANELRRLEQTVSLAHQPKLVTASGWKCMQDDLIATTAGRLIKELSLGDSQNLTADLVDAYCPGFSALVRSMHSSLWASLGEQPRQMKDSDFVDAIHGLYAPYVDIFRADRYMAPHIQTQVSRHGTVVVSSTNDLLQEIERQIRDQGSHSKTKEC